MNTDETIQQKAAAAADKAQAATEEFIDDPKGQIKRRAGQAAGDASYAFNSLVDSIEDCTRRSPGCALLIAGLIGVCVGRHFYKK